jgi:hypothetical protein
MVEITQSALGDFAACEQRYVFRYLLRLRRREIALPLLIGSAVHKGFEHLVDPSSALGYDARMPLVRSTVHEEFDKAQEQTDLLTPTVEGKMEQARAQALSLLEAWFIVYGDIFKDWKWIHTEMRIRSQEGACLCSPLVDRMAGMIDGVVIDPDDNLMYLVEHKTRSRMDTLDSNSLDLDAQANWYIILCRVVLTRLQERAGQINTLMPQGFFYNAMKKPQHRTPRDDFEGLTKKMVQAIVTEPDKYFSLDRIQIEQQVIDRHWDNFQRMIKRMDSLTPEIVTMNTRACEDYAGCPFKPLCQNCAHAGRPEEVLNLPPIDLYEIAPQHPELEEDAFSSTDKIGA